METTLTQKFLGLFLSNNNSAVAQPTETATLKCAFQQQQQHYGACKPSVEPSGQQASLARAAEPAPSRARTHTKQLSEGSISISSESLISADSALSLSVTTSPETVRVAVQRSSAPIAQQQPVAATSTDTKVQAAPAPVPAPMPAPAPVPVSMSQQLQLQQLHEKFLHRKIDPKDMPKKLPPAPPRRIESAAINSQPVAAPAKPVKPAYPGTSATTAATKKPRPNLLPEGFVLQTPTASALARRRIFREAQLGTSLAEA